MQRFLRWSLGRVLVALLPLLVLSLVLLSTYSLFGAVNGQRNSLWHCLLVGACHLQGGVRVSLTTHSPRCTLLSSTQSIWAFV